MGTVRRLLADTAGHDSPKPGSTSRGFPGAVQGICWVLAEVVGSGSLSSGSIGGLRFEGCALFSLADGPLVSSCERGFHDIFYMRDQ